MTRPTLGEKIKIRAIAKKSRQTSPDNGMTISNWVSERLDNVTDAIYIGYRTISDCAMQWHYDENGDHEYPVKSNHREAWLVVISERKNPVYIFPHHIIEKDAQS